MILRRFTVIILALSASDVGAQQVTVPSGLEIELYDVILEPDANIARFRFRVPAIGGDAGVTFAEALLDIQYLCDDVVIPSLAQNGWTDGEIVISLSNKEVAFGVASPDVVQYFQPFSIQAGACMWEDF
jgi:heme/copper-type cytochrome/quinol oxidase subunit 2